MDSYYRDSSAVFDVYMFRQSLSIDYGKKNKQTKKKAKALTPNIIIIVTWLYEH